MAKDKNKATAAVADPENDGRVDDGLTEDVIVAAPEGALATEVDWSSYGDDHKKEGHALKAEEIIIPMLKIVQDQSKCYKNQDKTKAVLDYELGDIYNSISGQVYKKGVLLVPLECTACVVERKPSPDGSFIAKLGTRDPRVQQAYNDNEKSWVKLTTKQKTQLVYTEEVPVGLIDPENPESVYRVALVPFSGTNVFPRRQWWDGMAEAPHAKDTPRYAFRTVLKTVFRKSTVSGGVDSYKFTTEPYDPPGRKGIKPNWSECRLRPGHPTLDSCLDFLKLYRTGVLGKADYTDVDATDTESSREATILDDKPAF